MDLREPADGREVLRRALEHPLELELPFVELTELDERAAEGDARREVSGMNREAGPAGVDRFLMYFSGPPALFGELGKSNRRRILLDPASQIVNARIFGHQSMATVDELLTRHRGCFELLRVHES